MSMWHVLRTEENSQSRNMILWYKLYITRNW